MRRLFFALSLPFCVVLSPTRPDSLPTGRPSDPPSGPVAVSTAPLPTQAEMERLLRSDPIAFLENCLRRQELHVPARPEVASGLAGLAAQPPGIQAWASAASLMGAARQINGYSLIMQKQERIDEVLKPLQVVQVHFHDRPYSVYMQWLKGAGQADRALYVEGANDGKALAHPSSFLARKIVGNVVARDPDGPDARKEGRYTIKEFGLKSVTQRTLAFCKADLAKGILHIHYEGVKKIKEAGDRPCWVMRFTYDQPQRDMVTNGTAYFDTETWLQVGNVLRRADGSLVAAYYFRDIRINPAFAKNQFERSALIP